MIASLGRRTRNGKKEDGGGKRKDKTEEGRNGTKDDRRALRDLDDRCAMMIAFG